MSPHWQTEPAPREPHVLLTCPKHNISNVIPIYPNYVRTSCFRTLSSVLNPLHAQPWTHVRYTDTVEHWAHGVCCHLALSVFHLQWIISFLSVMFIFCRSPNRCTKACNNLISELWMLASTYYWQTITSWNIIISIQYIGARKRIDLYNVS